MYGMDLFIPIVTKTSIICFNAIFSVGTRRAVSAKTPKFIRTRHAVSLQGLFFSILQVYGTHKCVPYNLNSYR